MNINLVSFQIRDVITIVIGVGSLLSFYYALKLAIDKLRKEVDYLNSKQNSDIDEIMETLKENKDDFEKRELQIYRKITEVREDQKNSNDKLEKKIDKIYQDIGNINNNLSELTGYIRAKESR